MLPDKQLKINTVFKSNLENYIYYCTVHLLIYKNYVKSDLSPSADLEMASCLEYIVSIH